MYILNMEIKEDRQVVFSDNSGGNILENNATLLNIRIPKIYSSYYKYLDIVKDNKEKTQTVVSSKDEYILTYLLPDALTGARELTCQLVLKKDAEVFKSNIFKLTFSGSINSTQLIENKNPDTLEFLMENKADRQELIKTEERKLDKNTFYSFRDTQGEINNLKADKSEINNLLADKVDKVKGKGLSTNDFTNLLKTRLEEGVVNYIGEISSEDELKDITSYGIHTFILKDYNTTSYDENTVRKSGFLINDSDEYYKITGQQLRTIYQYIFYPESRMLKFRTTQNETEWTEFETCGYISEEDFSAALKDKLYNLYSREEIDLIKDTLDGELEAVSENTQYAHERIDILSQIADENFNLVVNSLSAQDSGEQIILRDAAESSKLDISVNEGVTITRFGKNIIPYPYKETTKENINGVTYTDNGDGTITVSGNATAYSDFQIYEGVPIVKGGYITLSAGKNYTNMTVVLSLYNDSNILIDQFQVTTRYANQDIKKVNLSTYPEATKWNISIKRSNVGSVSGTLYPQIEIGETATEYEEYKEPISVIAGADGKIKNLTALSPVTALVTDTEGEIISCNYFKDVNKAFEELKWMIISLGGNV